MRSIGILLCLGFMLLGAAGDSWAVCSFKIWAMTSNCDANGCREWTWTTNTAGCGDPVVWVYVRESGTLDWGNPISTNATSPFDDACPKDRLIDVKFVLYCTECEGIGDEEIFLNVDCP